VRKKMKEGSYGSETRGAIERQGYWAVAHWSKKWGEGHHWSRLNERDRESSGTEATVPRGEKEKVQKRQYLRVRDRRETPQNVGQN